MQDIPGYRLITHLEAPQHASCWYATREADGSAALVVVDDLAYHDAAALSEALALARSAQDLDSTRLRVPRSVGAHGDCRVVELDDARAELGLRDASRLTARLGPGTQRTPQEATRLALALIRALAPLNAALVPDHFNIDRVLLSADGRVRFDPIHVPSSIRTNIVGRAGPVVAYRDMAPEVVRAEQLDARTCVFFVGLVLHGLITGLDPRPPRSNDFQRLTDIVEGRFDPDAQSALLASAPELSAIVTRATASAPDARYADLTALARALHAQAARYEDSFPPPDAPDLSHPERLLEALRESLNAGHLSAALAHLDRATDEVYHHPAVRDYVQQHAQHHRLDAIVDAIYAPHRLAEPPFDWAALHLAIQHPDVSARFFADSLGRNTSREPARARLSLWASGRHPVLPPPQTSPPTLAAPTAPNPQAPPMLHAPPVPLGAMQLARCAKGWDDLRDTDAGADVRFCDACDQRVTRVERIGDLIGLAGSCAYVTPAALNTLDVTDTLDMRPQSDGGGVTGGVAPLPEEPGGMVGGLVELNEHGEPLPDLDPVLFTQEELEALGLPTGPPKKRSLVQRLRDWWSDDDG